MNELKKDAIRYIFAASPGVNPSLVKSSLKFIAELREEEIYIETEPKKLMPPCAARYCDICNVIYKKRIAPSFVVCAILAVFFAVILKAWWLIIFTPLFLLRGINYVVIINTTSNTSMVVMSAKKAPMAEFESELQRRLTTFKPQSNIVKTDCQSL